jgi:cellobiose phosphorylase
MIYKFIDAQGTFIVGNPQRYNLYLPLTNRDGSILSCITPNLAGDIKTDNDHFLSPPASIEDLRSNLLCRRDFFLKLDEKTIRLSYPSNDVLEVGFLYQRMSKETKTLSIEILNFVPYNLAVEVMRVSIKNKTKKTLKIIPTSFIPLYGRSEKNLRDHRHVSSLLNRIQLDRYGIYLKPTMIFDEKGHKINETTYFVLGFEDKTRPPQGQFPTLDYFYGQGDLISPDAIERNIKPTNKKSSEFDGKEVCAAFRFRERHLRANEEVNYFLIMGVSKKTAETKNTFRKLNSLRKIAQSFQETKKYWLNYLSVVNFDFKDKNFNNWLLWVKLQPVLRKLFGCSFLPHFDYGKGGRGWRDLWQDVLTLLITESAKTRDFILNNFKGVRIDGSNASVITKEGEFISDRNRINRVWMDHGIWPYLALRLYLNKTGDLSILLKRVPYFQDQQLKRAKEIDFNFSQKDYLLRSRTKKIYQGSLLEHTLLQHLVQFFNVGKHNIIRLENADWNDGLDMAPEQGESAAFSFMYAHNLRDICLVLKKLREKRKSILLFKESAFLLDTLNSRIDYSSYKAKQKRLDAYLEKTQKLSGEKVNIKIDDLICDLEKKSEHLFKWLQKEWLGNLGFFNGYYDNQGKRVEGKFKNSIRIILTSQVFAIMSQIATQEQVKKTWSSIKRYLQDKKLGGVRLNTNFHALYPYLGRAFSFSYGDKENGAFFNHMSVMLAHALYKRNFRKEGLGVMDSIYKMALGEEAQIYPMVPEYFNSEGKGLYHYLTGSASWYIYTLLQEVLGIKFLWGDIIFKPKLLATNFFNHETIEVKFPFQDKNVKAIFQRKINKNSSCEIKKVFLEEKRVIVGSYGCLIKNSLLQKINKKEITVKIYLG